jgi:hypothetical protein
MITRRSIGKVYAMSEDIFKKVSRIKKFNNKWF